MEEVQKIIKTIFTKIKKIEESNPKYGTELSEYLNELYEGLNFDNPELYRVSENRNRKTGAKD